MGARLGKRIKKKKLCTLGDLWKSYSLGTASDEPAIAKLDPSQTIALRMLADLEKAGYEWRSLAAYVKQQGWTEQRRVQVGDERGYIIQKNGTQLFIRVPVDVLGTEQGALLSVQFKAETIVIRKPERSNWVTPKIRPDQLTKAKD